MEKEKDCGSTNSHSMQQKKLSQKKEKQAHQSHQAPPAQTAEPQTHDQTGQAYLKCLPKKDHRNSPDLPFDQKNVKRPPQKQNSHYPSLLLFSPLSFTLIAHSHRSFFFFLPSSLNQLLKKLSSCIALYSLMASPFSFGNAPLSLRIFSPARFHNPFCAIKPSISNLFRSL